MAAANKEQDASSAMRQKLMSADEVYVYKIPPLKTAGGHRAEDWNLANPLKTCHLLVERRGDLLVLEFTAADNNTLFCQSSIDLSSQSQSSSNNNTSAAITKLEQWVEPVVDTSRYFVVKIQGDGGRQALVGFGFRERETATDFRESLQFYEKSMQREQEASKHQGMEFHIPQLAAGEKIHVNRGGKSTITSDKCSNSSNSVPVLKKKPPSSPPRDEKPIVNVDTKAVEKMTFNLAGIDLDAPMKKTKGGGEDDDDVVDAEDNDDTSGGAVYEGDEEQWSTEFSTK